MQLPILISVTPQLEPTSRRPCPPPPPPPSQLSPTRFNVSRRKKKKRKEKGEGEKKSKKKENKRAASEKATETPQMEGFHREWGWVCDVVVGGGGWGWSPGWIAEPACRRRRLARPRYIPHTHIFFHPVKQTIGHPGSCQRSAASNVLKHEHTIKIDIDIYL